MTKVLIFILVLGLTDGLQAQATDDTLRPSRTEIISPIHKNSFNNNGECPERKQGGNPRMVTAILFSMALWMVTDKLIRKLQ